MINDLEIGLGTSPYPGLRPFRREEAVFFFGREQQTDQALQRLQDAHFLAVVGASGCGKSSLVRAGMMAGLEAGLMATAGTDWRMVEMRPIRGCFQGLTRALLAPNALGPCYSSDPAAAALMEAKLRRGSFGLIEVLREASLPERTNLLILVDQFEEILPYRPDVSADEADAFVALLLTAAQQKADRVFVVLTLRSEFLEECLLLGDHLLEALLNNSQFLTARMMRQHRARAITGPAAVFGARVEDALVNRILNDMGANPDQLPRMQHALMRMWTIAGGPEAVMKSGSGHEILLTLDHYQQVGGWEEALSRHADEVFEELSPRQREIAEFMFRRLTERYPAEGLVVRKPRSVAHLAEVAGVGVQEIVAVADVFRRPNRSFLMPPLDRQPELEPHTHLEICHVSLIRQWRRLNAWARDEADLADAFQEFRDRALRWQNGRDVLLSGPALERARGWQEKQRPNERWAERYGSAEEFALTVRFLGASEEEWAREIQEQEEHLRREQEAEIERRSFAERERRMSAEKEALQAAAHATEADAEAEAERTRGRVAEALAEERFRAKKGLKRWIAALAFALLVAILAAGWALQQTWHARAVEQEARQKERQSAVIGGYANIAGSQQSTVLGDQGRKTSERFQIAPR